MQPASLGPLSTLLLSVIGAASLAVRADAQTLYSVGASNSPSALEIAEVTAAAPFADGRLVLLDGKERVLYLVSRDGKRIRKAGRKGFGPGEFEAPTRLAIDANNNVLVFDPPMRRFSWFKVVGDSLVFQRSDNVLEGVREFCVTSDRLYVTQRLGRPILAYRMTSNSLELIDSLGTSNLRHPLASHPMVQGYGQDGPIGCGGPSQQVLWHSAMLDAGQLILKIGKPVDLRLPDFPEIAMTAGDNTVTLSIPKAGMYERVRGIVAATPSSYFVVSAMERVGERNYEYRVRTLSSNGRVSAPTTVKSRLYGYQNGIAVCEPVSEIPQLIVVRSVPSADRYPCDNTLLKKAPQ